MQNSPALSAFVTGLSLMLSLIVAIGAQNSFVLRQGLRREHVAAVVAACALLDALLMVLGVLGLGAVISHAPGLLDGLGLLGALVLTVYGALALRRALHPQALHSSSAGQAVPHGRVVAQVLSLSLLNPHVYLDTVVLVGAVGAQQAAGLRGVFLLGSCLASLLWFAALGFGARLLTPLFARPAAWRLLDVLVAATMASVAWQLASSSLHLS